MASVAIEPLEEVIDGCDWERQDATFTRQAPAGLIDHAQSLRWQQVVARSWSDPAFKQRLLNDPVETLRAEGLEVPAGRQLKVVEQTDALDFLILPAKPEELEDCELGEVTMVKSSMSGCMSVSRWCFCVGCG